MRQYPEIIGVFLWRSAMRFEVVKARELVKKYNDFKAVKGIDFEVRAGECFGFLGPNGAGKTTTIKMISCFVPITGGNLQVLGYDVRTDPRRIKALLGVLPQEDNLDPELTVTENLMLYAGYFDIAPREGAERAKELLSFIGLEEKAGEEVEHLSGGMKRRLAIARALINRPKLLILDEPTTGLDPEARYLVWEKMRQLKERGTTLLLTTHYLEEAAQLCDRLVIMDRGMILETGTPGELILRNVGREVLELAPVDNNVQTVIDYAGDRIMDYRIIGQTLFLYTSEGRRVWQRIMNNYNLGHSFSHQMLRPATLEDVFLKLTGRGLV